MAFAAAVAFDCVAWHRASICDVAKLVASSTLGERGAGDPFGESDRFAEHGQVSFFHRLCDGAIAVNESKRYGRRVTSD
jgi:hypothetical protein